MGTELRSYGRKRLLSSIDVGGVRILDPGVTGKKLLGGSW
jgi:hypothetical protein